MAVFDEEVVRRQLVNRDPSGLEALVQHLGPKSYQLARLVLGGIGNHQDVEEVVSDALAAVWERAAEFKPERSTLTNWVLMLTKYAALDRRRALWRRSLDGDGQVRVIPLAAAPEPTSPAAVEERMLQEEEQVAVFATLERLPEQERELLIRRYWFEESLVEMARDLGLSRGALDTRLWRARQKMKALLSSQKEVQAHDR